MLHRDLGENVGVLLDIGNRRARDVDADGARALGALGRVGCPALGGHYRNSQDIGKKRYLDIVVCHLGIGTNGEARTVRDELDSVTVENTPPRGKRGDGSGAVALSLLSV